MVTLKVRVSFRWWLKPYLALTRIGLMCGLPLDFDQIGDDIKRAVVVTVVEK